MAICRSYATLSTREGRRTYKSDRIVENRCVMQRFFILVNLVLLRELSLDCVRQQHGPNSIRHESIAKKGTDKGQWNKYGATIIAGGR